jgi:hypothetical protein
MRRAFSAAYEFEFEDFELEGRQRWGEVGKGTRMYVLLTSF